MFHKKMQRKGLRRNMVPLLGQMGLDGGAHHQLAALGGCSPPPPCPATPMLLACHKARAATARAVMGTRVETARVAAGGRRRLRLEPLLPPGVALPTPWVINGTSDSLPPPAWFAAWWGHRQRARPTRSFRQAVCCSLCCSFLVLVSICGVLQVPLAGGMAFGVRVRVRHGVRCVMSPLLRVACGRSMRRVMYRVHRAAVQQHLNMFAGRTRT